MNTLMALALDTHGEAAPARCIRARNAGYPPPALKIAGCYWWVLAYAQQERASCLCLPGKRGAMHRHWRCAAVAIRSLLHRALSWFHTSHTLNHTAIRSCKGAGREQG